MCLEAVLFWPVFLCLFWAMFLCPVRACFLACAPSGVFWAFFCASFFEGNKSSRGVSPDTRSLTVAACTRRCEAAAGIGRGVGTRTEHGAWAQWPPGDPPQQRPSTPTGRARGRGELRKGRAGEMLNQRKRISSLILGAD
jgi:hypothetical protein